MMLLDGMLCLALPRLARYSVDVVDLEHPELPGLPMTEVRFRWRRNALRWTQTRSAVLISHGWKVVEIER